MLIKGSERSRGRTAAAALGGAAGLVLMAPAAGASAASSAASDPDAEQTITYQAKLRPLNHQGGGGWLKLRLNGSTAHITEHWYGLAAKFNGKPYPHVQHIHGGSRGRCPSMSADENHDGVVSTVEGRPAYGPVQTTLSVKGDITPKAGTDLRIAPKGPSARYKRTITLSPATVASLHKGIAVVAVHGDDPKTLSPQAQKEKSELVPSLPLAATAPALCGVLNAMPMGAAGTGSGSTAVTDGATMGAWLFGGAAGLAGTAALGRLLIVRRRNRSVYQRYI